MNDIYYTQLKKKISRRAVILAVVIILSLPLTMLPLLIGLPPFGAYIFSFAMWGKIGPVSGSYFEVFSTMGVFIICILPLLVWGAVYPKKDQYAVRLRIWYICFCLLLAYCAFISAILHIRPLFINYHTTLPPEYYPAPYSELDKIASRSNDEPPLFSWLFVAYVVQLIIYTSESLYMIRLLRRAKAYKEHVIMADIEGSFLS